MTQLKRIVKFLWLDGLDCNEAYYSFLDFYCAWSENHWIKDWELLFQFQPLLWFDTRAFEGQPADK